MGFTRINGTPIKSGSIPGHTWNADLVDFNGPLISLYRSERGEDVLYVWIDRTERQHRWAIVPISRDSLRDYLREHITLREVFSRSKEIIVFNVGSTYKRSAFQVTNWTLFPEEYRPKENSFLNDAIATDAARRLASDSTEDYMLGLDGEDLYIEDLSAIQKNFVQLYSFHYGFEYLDREAVQLKISSHANNWTGGMSSVWMFDGLSSVIPSVHRPRVAELRFNSPGHIKLNLLPELALEVQLSIDRITNPITFKLTEEFYNQVYKYFKSSGISGFESEQRNIRQKLTQEVKASLSGFVQRFLLLMAWPNGSKMLAELEESPLSQLRLLLAYYRRLRRLRGFVVDGRLDVGSSKLVAKEN